MVNVPSYYINEGKYRLDDSFKLLKVLRGIISWKQNIQADILFEGNKVTKRFHSRSDFLTELRSLRKLAKYKYFPKIISLDHSKKQITMLNAGKQLNIYQFSQQNERDIRAIKKILDLNEIYHNDIKFEHFLIYEDTVILIDFGRSTDKSIAPPYRNDFELYINVCKFITFLCVGHASIGSTQHYESILLCWQSVYNIYKLNA